MTETNQLTAEAAEAYVRGAWERVLQCDGSYRGFVRGTILIFYANHQYWIFADWLAALEFTLAREEEVNKLRELRLEVPDANLTDIGKRCVFGMIDERLAELTRGWKEPK